MNSQVPRLHPTFLRWCHGCRTLCFWMDWENLKYRAEGRRSLTKSMTLEATKKKNHWASKSPSPSPHFVLSACHKEGLAMQAFPSLALEGQTAKSFSHSRFVYILLPGPTAYYSCFLWKLLSHEQIWVHPNPSVLPQIQHLAQINCWHNPRQLRAQILFTKQTK